LFACIHTSGFYVPISALSEDEFGDEDHTKVENEGMEVSPMNGMTLE
jgi:hypothetical protein